MNGLVVALDEAQRHLPGVYNFEGCLRDCYRDLAVAGDDDPAYHERRIEFCRAVLEQFPDADRELHLDFRHGVAESLAELGREADSRAQYEAIAEEFPDDPWAPLALADSHWRDAPGDATADDLERAADLYRRTLDRDVEQPSEVRNRLEEVQQRLDEIDSE